MQWGQVAQDFLKGRLSQPSERGLAVSHVNQTKSSERSKSGTPTSSGCLRCRLWTASPTRPPARVQLPEVGMHRDPPLFPGSWGDTALTRLLRVQRGRMARSLLVGSEPREDGASHRESIDFKFEQRSSTPRCNSLMSASRLTLIVQIQVKRENDHSRWPCSEAKAARLGLVVVVTSRVDWIAAGVKDLKVGKLLGTSSGSRERSEIGFQGLRLPWQPGPPACAF